MPVTERIMAPGDFSLRLKPEMPALVRKAIDWRHTTEAGLAHIVLVPAGKGSAPRELNDPLTASRYTGVVLEVDNFALRGAGMWWWLEDDQGRGPLLESLHTNTSANLSTWMTGLKPNELDAGTYGTPGGPALLTAQYQWITRGAAVRSVCEQFSELVGITVEARVDARGRLHANSTDALYSTVTPLVTRRRGNQSVSSLSNDLTAHALGGRVSLREYLSKVRAAGPSEIGTASTSTTYYGINSVAAERTVYASVPDAPAGGEDRVAAQILDLNGSRSGVTLALDAYDVAGDFTIGQSLKVWDPELGIFDLTATAITADGVMVNPLLLRVLAYTWPIREGFTVWHRAQAVSTTTWTELTDWVEFENGPATIDVGQLPRTRSNVSVGRPQLETPVEEKQWVGYTPSWSGTLGNGTLVGAYRREGSSVHFRIKLLWGSTTSHGATGQNFGLPITANGTYAFLHPVGTAIAYNAGLAKHPGIARTESTSIVQIIDTLTNLDASNTQPFTWGNTDEMMISGTYEAAIT